MTGTDKGQNKSLGGPVWGHALDSMILMSPFLHGLLYDSVIPGFGRRHIQERSSGGIELHKGKNVDVIYDVAGTV